VRISSADATLASDVLSGTAALVVVLDGDTRVLDANPATSKALDRAPQELIGQEAAAILCSARSSREMLRMLRVVARTGESRGHEHDLPPAGRTRVSIAWVTSRLHADPVRLVCVGVDVSEARTAADDLLTRSLTDELTGLPNRAHLLQSLQRMSSSGCSVLFCDLNGFKAVNDMYGHAAGDRVLVEVARRLKLAVRGEDLVARLGGDEFVIVAPPHPTASPEGLTRRVLGAMRQPMLLGSGVVVVVGVSVGTAEMQPGQDPSEVLEHADAHMYTAKSLRATGVGRTGGQGGSSD
jgi:diguanylate cyclase (GGDEF)-like protein